MCSAGDHITPHTEGPRRGAGRGRPSAEVPPKGGTDPAQQARPGPVRGPRASPPFLHRAARLPPGKVGEHGERSRSRRRLSLHLRAGGSAVALRRWVDAEPREGQPPSFGTVLRSEVASFWFKKVNSFPSIRV